MFPEIFVKICETTKCHNFLIFQPIFIKFSPFCLIIFTLSSAIKLNLFRNFPLTPKTYQWHTSPFVQKVKRFERAPSGQQARMTRERALAGSRLKAMASEKASRGIRQNWHVIPMMKLVGRQSCGDLLEESIFTNNEYCDRLRLDGQYFFDMTWTSFRGGSSSIV